MHGSHDAMHACVFNKDSFNDDMIEFDDSPVPYVKTKYAALIVEFFNRFFFVVKLTKTQ